MKFALVEGHRREARPGLPGECQKCGTALVAKCGDIRVWHWAHRGRRTCDHWWENETEWHRAWKNQFPVDWQEILHQAKDGEKHIADVKTVDGCVIEFQHSYLKSEERRTREAFYGRIVWVVDGLRRKRDRPQFFDVLSRAPVARGKLVMFSIPGAECALLRDWADSRTPVYFDFGEIDDLKKVIGFKAPILWHLNQPVLWRLDPKSKNGWRHLVPVLRNSFRLAFLEGLPLKGVAYPPRRRRARF